MQGLLKWHFILADFRRKIRRVAQKIEIMTLVFCENLRNNLRKSARKLFSSFLLALMRVEVDRF